MLFLLVFTQVMVGFRYGREDLDVLGLNFRRDLVDVWKTCHIPLLELCFNYTLHVHIRMQV